MIRNPNDIQDGAKKIRMLIAGYPGIGKSTLALSAPRPLHIDCDFGIDRIEPRYRMPYIDQENDTRKTALKSRPLAAPKNYIPWIRAKNMVG